MDESEKPPWLRASKSKKTFDILYLLRVPRRLLIQAGGKPAYLIFAVLIIVAIGAAVLFYFKYQGAIGRARSLLGSSSTNVEEASKLIQKVGKLTDLPNETPTVATISDAAKLQSQPFFAKAQNGDKVLIYTNAKKAYLYRPSTNKIIDIGPVSFPTPTSIKITPKVTGEEETTPGVSPSTKLTPPTTTSAAPTPTSTP